MKKQISINVEHKISSLLRRQQPFYALSFCWINKQLIIHPDQNAYFQSIINIRDIGMAKRSECYLDQFIQFGGVQYAIYLVSYGDIRKWKMVYGENPIAKSFGRCMLDYVFLFVQTKQFANNKIKIRLRELAKLQKWNEFNEMTKSAQTLFGGTHDKQHNSNTQINRFSTEIKEQSQQN